MLVGGMDLSGRPNDDSKYMGLVVGVEENLVAMIKNLEINKIHSATLKTSRMRRELASKLEFNYRENIALCIRLDKHDIIENAKKKISPTRYRAIHRRYNHLLYKFIHEDITKFTTSHKEELSRINFQCDLDCLGFVVDNNLCHSKNAFIHTLSDLVAWANNDEMNIDGLIHLDSTEWIKEKLNENLK